MKKENISYWTKSAAINEFPAMEQNIRTEILIVGGGIAGIMTAYRLAEAGRDVTLVEGRKLVQETTANTTAKITAQHHLLYQELYKKQGQEKARLFYDSQIDGIDAIDELVTKYQIDCDFERLSSTQLTDGRSEKAIRKEYDTYEKLGIRSELHEGDMGLPFKTTLGLEMPDQAQFHPVKFLAGMVEACKEVGVKFYEETLVEEIGKVQATTDKGHTIDFQKIIVATHFPIANARNNIISQVEIERSYIVAADGVNIPHGMFQTVDAPKRSLRHYHTENGVGVLVGGENHITGATCNMESAYEKLSASASEFFKGNVTDRWSAQDMMTVDRMPLIGQYDKKDPNVYIVTGFNKFGMATSATAAQLLTDLILRKENRYEELFRPERINTVGNQVKAVGKQIKDAVKGEALAMTDYGTDTSKLKAEEGGIFNVDGKLQAVYKDTDGQEHHVSPFCTHMGCVVKFNDAEKTWDCPCHGSRFDREGCVLEGPATQNLK
ncbi:FAD-dependent oxidoreductase [Macrococcus carouselicus]|uniref:FAD-dependent oxidoreductase n=1 Tax=Macrococcus carouselicus TaxID=69969 RepID=A0A9Q8FK77_9STAP|nr:FAD-dependent oxidoreductase [Macrococcus carouselicus]TDL96608.1 FAD-dependent oxidoreductase [Macrococcus carouselicus]